jgi:hypothetical protein
MRTAWSVRERSFGLEMELEACCRVHTYQRAALDPPFAIKRRSVI